MEPDEALSESLALDRLMEVEEDRDSFLQPSPAVGESFLLPSSKTRSGEDWDKYPGSWKCCFYVFF